MDKVLAEDLIDIERSTALPPTPSRARDVDADEGIREFLRMLHEAGINEGMQA